MTARISGRGRLMAFLVGIPVLFSGCFTGLFDGSAPDLVVSVSPGACVFSDGISSTPVTASIAPAGGGTIVLTKTGTGPVHTFPTSGATYDASPGGYTWETTAISVNSLGDPSTGGFTATSCPSDLIPTDVSVSPGACVFTDSASLTPVTASITPAGGATIVLTKTGAGPVHTFPTDGATFNASHGAYTWMATTANPYVLSGSSTGGFTAASCKPPKPISVTSSVSPGPCVFTDDASWTPVTASITPAGGATIVLTKTGTGPVHTFPTSGTGYNASPDSYTWVANPTSGYALSGPSNGAFTATMCPPPEPSPSPYDPARPRGA